MLKDDTRKLLPTAPGTISSWAVPTPEDDALWEAMTREQQVAAMQDYFRSPECTTSTDNSVDDVVARARARRDKKSVR